jgi:hypothetical protein
MRSPFFEDSSVCLKAYPDTNLATISEDPPVFWERLINSRLQVAFQAPFPLRHGCSANLLPL